MHQGKGVSKVNPKDTPVVDITIEKGEVVKSEFH